ncbi:beta-hexosaminidase 1-like [Vicia villosa]|uniref:beta-hexosaminidase 1-like n=1 Tax=Vicia villosa TaxID=3911 RepID=UPI00273CD2DA|nr:beta-hexosaminidase 1-like [Vicia villosa]
MGCCCYYKTLLIIVFTFFISQSFAAKFSLPFIWPLPAKFAFGNETLSVDPTLSLIGNSANSPILKAGFDRFKGIVFSNGFVRAGKAVYDVNKLNVVVQDKIEELQLGVDESYNLLISKATGSGKVIIKANTVFGALRGLETFSQLCSFDYSTKTVQIYKAPWSIRDKPRFPFRGLMLDTSRHYFPVNVIKQIIESMSYAKLNVLHWHIVDEQSFPLEVPSYPNLWQGSYSNSERYTVEDAYEIVNFAKMRGINIMAEIDVPGHTKSWGIGYPDVWPSPSCKSPLDVSKESTFDVLSGIMTDMRKIFPFELFHLGADEVNTDCWTNTSRVNKWLQSRNMTAKDAYEYFVLKAQNMALSKNWTPVNWEETFNAFPEKLHPQTIVHNWWSSGVCPKVVAKGLRCIFSNQRVWYLDHVDVPWDVVYNADPLEGIYNASEQKLVLGGEVCMWGEEADTSDVQQTIWPRAAAAAERLWSPRQYTTVLTASPRLQYFRCLLNRRGVPAAPVTNFHARTPPTGPGSCFEQ